MIMTQRCAQSLYKSPRVINFSYRNFIAELLNSVYTIQPALQPVVQGLFRVYAALSNRYFAVGYLVVSTTVVLRWRTRETKPTFATRIYRSTLCTNIFIAQCWWLTTEIMLFWVSAFSFMWYVRSVLSCGIRAAYIGQGTATYLILLTKYKHHI